MIVNDYRNNRRKSMWSLEHVRLPKLGEGSAPSKKDGSQPAALFTSYIYSPI